ncbi:MAG: thioredoxin [Clostridiales bacterium]|nr:thioredoxin [Clostridiales bacterium]
MIKQVNTQQFDELLKGSMPIVCDFFATWCGPCKMLAPVMEQISEELKMQAYFVKVDIDDNMELAARYGIMSIPTVMIFKNGEEVAKTMGFMPKSEAIKFVQNNI